MSLMTSLPGSPGTPSPPNGRRTTASPARSAVEEDHAGQECHHEVPREAGLLEAELVREQQGHRSGKDDRHEGLLDSDRDGYRHAEDEQRHGEPSGGTDRELPGDEGTVRVIGPVPFEVQEVVEDVPAAVTNAVKVRPAQAPATARPGRRCPPPARPVPQQASRRTIPRGCLRAPDGALDARGPMVGPFLTVVPTGAYWPTGIRIRKGRSRPGPA